MMGLLKLGAFGVVAFAIAIYARGKGADMAPVVEAPQAAAVTLASKEVPFSVEGTVVLDTLPAADAQPFVLYQEQKDDGTSFIKTKRLVFRAGYACTAGDIPCAVPVGQPYPVRGGELIRVSGTADADVLYVDALQILR